MKKFGLVMAMALSFGFGCGKGNKGDKILSEMEGFKNKVCACKDQACVDKVEADMAKWAEGMMKDMKDTKPTKEQDEKADKIQDEFEACKKKIAPAGGDMGGGAAGDTGAGAAGTDPAGGSAAPAGDTAGSAAGSAATP